MPRRVHINGASGRLPVPIVQERHISYFDMSFSHMILLIACYVALEVVSGLSVNL